MNDATSERQPPVDRIKSLDGLIVIPIWRNENADGKISYSVTEPERTYFDKQANEYKTTTTIFDRDAMEVSKLYSLANDRIRELREADYQLKKAAEGDQSAIEQQAA